MRSWLMATSNTVMQGWEQRRDFATVKDAVQLVSAPDEQAAAIPVLFLLFCLREIKLVSTCADVQTVHGCKKLRPFGLGPFFRAREENQRACSLPYSSQRPRSSGQGRSCIGPSVNAPYLASIVYRLHLGSFAGDWRSLPLPSRWQSRPNAPHTGMPGR